MWICVVNVAVNVAGNAILMRHLGVAGIALSTSCVDVVSCALILVSATRERRRRAA